jgi:hypothetical protein
VAQTNSYRTTKSPSDISFLWQFQDSIYFVLHEGAFFTLKDHAVWDKGFNGMPHTFGDVHAILTLSSRFLSITIYFFLLDPEN